MVQSTMSPRAISPASLTGVRAARRLQRHLGCSAEIPGQIPERVIAALDRASSQPKTDPGNRAAHKDNPSNAECGADYTHVITLARLGNSPAA
jgi:hypothetical protein